MDELRTVITEYHNCGDDAIRYEYQYRVSDGKLHGYSISRRRDGTIRSKCYYVNGFRHGVYESDVTGNSYWLYHVRVTEEAYIDRTIGRNIGETMTEFGYHMREMPKGTIGEISKIEEELEELKDAMEQDCRIMALLELSDLYGAIELFLDEKFGMEMDELKSMSDITQRAFRSGARK